MMPMAGCIMMKNHHHFFLEHTPGTGDWTDEVKIVSAWSTRRASAGWAKQQFAGYNELEARNSGCLAVSITTTVCHSAAPPYK